MARARFHAFSLMRRPAAHVRRMYPGQAFSPKSAYLAFALLAAGALAGAARADEAAATPAWTFGGFGTIGIVHSDERQADFTSSVLKSSGAGYSRSWSGDVDSRVGMQVGASLNRQWSAVLQVIAEQGIDGSYKPIVEWCNIK